MSPSGERARLSAVKERQQPAGVRLPSDCSALAKAQVHGSVMLAPPEHRIFGRIISNCTPPGTRADEWPAHA